MNKSLRLLVAATLLAPATVSLLAAEIQWTGSQETSPPYNDPIRDSGSFFNPGCWLNLQVPATDDTAILGVDLPMSNGNIHHSPHTIHFGNFNSWDLFMGDHFFSGGDVVLRNLRIESDTWVFNFASAATGGSSPPASIGSLTVRDGFAQITGSPTANTTLTVKNGIFALNGPGGPISSLVLKGGPGPAGGRTAGELVVDGTNAVVSVTNIAVLEAGRLVVKNGATFLADHTYGYEAYLTVSGPGSFLQGFASVARGEIRIEKGGKVSSWRVAGPAAATVGWCDSDSSCGQRAHAYVSGAGSLWTDIGVLWLGGNPGTDTRGAGAVLVDRGGEIRSSSAYLANSSDYEGEVTISGTGSCWSNANEIVVGDFGRGNLTARYGGTVWCDTLSLGNRTNSSGRATVAAGGQINCRQAAVGGPAGRGNLDIYGGGLLVVGDLLEVGALGSIDLHPSPIPMKSLLSGYGYDGRLIVGTATDPDSVNDGSIQVSSDGTISISIDRTSSPVGGVIQAASVHLGGTLQVQNVGAPVVAGDIFQLFKATDFAGSFQSVNLPTLGSNLLWDATMLLVDGTIMVVNSNGSPLLRRQPTTSATGAGGTVNFLAAAAGLPPFNYQWQFNGVDIPGATESTLTLTNASPGQSGNYRVVVSNANGITESAPAALVVLPPIAVKMYAGLTIAGTVGSTYRIEVTADLQNSNVWSTLTNIVVPSIPYFWLDTESPTLSRRFYRAVPVP